VLALIQCGVSTQASLHAVSLSTELYLHLYALLGITSRDADSRFADPTALVARSVLIGKPIIAVNINYRLNIFGFGCSDEIIVTQGRTNLIRGGNFGLGDQRRALEWVVRNIGYFGGDKTRITIGGQSAGGSSAHAHVLDARLNCDKAKPLFRRAIIQSGAVGTLGPIALSKANANFELLRSEYPGLDIEELRKIPADVLVKKSKELGWWVFPLVNDGLTIKPTKVGRWQVCLGYEDVILDKQPRKDTREPLRVMIGDADAEASYRRHT
jgi:carboxylesterase type B